MTRKHLLSLVALVLLGTACAPPTEPNLPVSAGQRWLPQTVDFLSDAGRSPSIAVDSSGLPHLAYLGLNQKLKAGEIAPARPLSLPVIPAVLVSNLTKDGVWNHAAVVATQNVANPLPLKKNDLVAIAVDGDDNEHVAFTEKDELQYSAESGGAFGTPAKIAAGKFSALSIAVDPKGTPWVAWIQNGALKVATSSHGTKWAVQGVGAASGVKRPPPRTSIQVGPKGPVVAYTGPDGPMLAARSGGGWATASIGSGGGGFGISLALDGAGRPFVAYYASSGLVHLVQPSNGGSKTLFRAAGGPEHPSGWSASVGVDKKGTWYMAWYDATDDQVRLVRSGPGSPEIVTPGTENGELPQLAVTPDGGAVYVAWYDHVNLDLLLGTYVVSGQPPRGIAIAPVPATVSPTAAPTGGPSGACPKDEVEITAPPGAATSGFKPSTVSAPASGVTICFDNQDTGVAHNVAVFSDDPTANPGAKTLATGNIVTGVATDTIDAGKLAPGSYFFHCDVHPTTMMGTLTVK